MNKNFLTPLFASILATGLLSGCATAPSRKINIDYAYFLNHPLTPLDNAIRKPLERKFGCRLRALSVGRPKLKK